MNRLRVLALCIVIALGPAAFAFGQPAPAPANDVRRVLRVDIYPFIPESADAFFKIEQEFERLHPDIRLVISQNLSYYDPLSSDPKRQDGVFYDNADVYELDSVFLKDFIAAGKIAPLPGNWTEIDNGLVPMARTVMSQNGVQYGVPHWLCSYFLFFRVGDTQLASAGSLTDLEKAFGGPSGSSWLVAEFAGKSTLGELYLDDLISRSSSTDQALAGIGSETPDPTVVQDMVRSIRLIEPGLGRDSGDYHNRTGFYGHVFAHQGRAMVSYSEGLHDTLYETANGCLKGERCLADGDLDVVAWPHSDAGAKQVAWVDLLTISSAAKGQTLSDAETFIRFMDDPATYKLLLVPQPGGTPRYLLPALTALYSDPDVLKSAHLYQKLLPIIGGAIPVTAANLNTDLRAIGAKVDKMLPAN